MAARLRAITVRTSIALIEGKPGPLLTDFEWPLDAGAPYEFVPSSGATADSWAVLAPSGGGVGRWIRKRADKKGTALTDTATQTINSGGKPLRVLAGDLSQNGVLTLGVVNAVVGDEIRVVSRNTAAFTYTINNGGATPSTLTVFASATASWADLYFNGTDWEMTARGTLA